MKKNEKMKKRGPSLLSESTIAEQEEEVMSRDLDDEICIPVRCAVEYAVVFRANAVKSNIGRGRNNRKIS